MIPLKETEFDFIAINNSIIGAGVLPVSIDETGTVRLLLGKERYINHWRGSLKWSGFEGGRKDGEDVEHTAAREFMEESIGVVSMENFASTIESVKQFVISKKYVARIVLCITHGDHSEKRYHVTYLIQVPYNKEYSNIFAGRRRSFVDLQTKLSVYNRLTEQLKECVSSSPHVPTGTSIATNDAPISADDPKGAPIIADVPTTQNTSNIPLEGYTYEGLFVETIRRVEVIADTVLLIEFLDDKNQPQVHEFAGLDADIHDMYMRWMNAKLNFTNLCHELTLLNVNAMNVFKDKNGFIKNVTINEDFIEKQYVQWWNLQDLRIVIQNGGYINTEFFRAYFLPVLQRTIQELDTILESNTGLDPDISTLPHAQ
jgi:hypothetical protein